MLPFWHHFLCQLLTHSLAFTTRHLWLIDMLKLIRHCLRSGLVMTALQPTLQDNWRWREHHAAMCMCGVRTFCPIAGIREPACASEHYKSPMAGVEGHTYPKCTTSCDVCCRHHLVVNFSCNLYTTGDGGAAYLTNGAKVLDITANPYRPSNIPIVSTNNTVFNDGKSMAVAARDVEWIRYNVSQTQTQPSSCGHGSCSNLSPYLILALT